MPRDPSPKLSTTELLERECERLRADLAERGVQFTAGPFGLKAHKRGEEPSFRRRESLIGRIGQRNF